MTTYAWWEVVVPCSSLPSHALQYATAVQGVTLVTAERDGTSCKVTLVADFKAKLWHTGIITVWQLETCTERKKDTPRETEKGEKNKEHELENDIVGRPATELPEEQPFSKPASDFHLSVL